MAPNKSRRRLLQLLLAGGTGFSAYSYWRGIRFPTLGLEPAGLASELELNDTNIKLLDMFQTGGGQEPHQDNIDATFRAFSPEPHMQLNARKNKQLTIKINNLANDASLESSSSTGVHEQVNGTSRIIEISLADDETLSLHWRLPPLQTYSFAAIGDSGGADELAWCIQRAHQLGARFLLHLGDFNYQPGDYRNAIKLFNNAPLPCYVSIGNHDFNESGLVYQQFLSEIGPFNHQFSIGNTRYVNLDTAVSFLPYSGGHRGKLMEVLIRDKNLYTDTVAFTHRPLHDPQDDSDHDIGSEGERDWLVENLTRANIKTLLSGHIHIFDRSVVHGIDNIIVGQGLGHQDLIVNADHSKMALGKVDSGGRVSYEIVPLAMPMEMHCNPRSDIVKQSLQAAPHADVIREIDRACAQRTASRQGGQ